MHTHTWFLENTCTYMKEKETVCLAHSLVHNWSSCFVPTARQQIVREAFGRETKNCWLPGHREGEEKEKGRTLLQSTPLDLTTSQLAPLMVLAASNWGAAVPHGPLETLRIQPQQKRKRSRWWEEGSSLRAFAPGWGWKPGGSQAGQGRTGG